MSAPSGDASSRLARRLGLGDAVVIGLGSMIGAGVSAAIGPAARAAVYGRERLGPFWGYLARWGFVVGKAASDQWVFVHNDRDGMSAPIALQIAELDERSEDISCTDWGPTSSARSSPRSMTPVAPRFSAPRSLHCTS